MATVMKKVKRAGKRASKYQYTANFQSVVVECVKEKWLPHKLSVAWSRRGRRHFTSVRPWKASPDNRKRGVIVWPELEEIDITITLYKGQKDKKFETKEWEFAVIDTDESGKRKILANTMINMAEYASMLGLDQSLLLKLKPVSKKIRVVTLEVNLTSIFLKEGKATDDDMQSIASNLSCSKLSIIGILEDDVSMSSRSRGGSFDDRNSNNSRPVTPVMEATLIESQDELIKWAKRMTIGYRGLKITNMTTSWRNGLGFLAIIHHFRPDMLNYDELSALNIKENNQRAYLLARELGISCTIDPDNMASATVPDKLAIASFVYQLHSYFNENIPSAVSSLAVNKSIQPLPQKGMAEFDKITMSKLDSDSSLVGTGGSPSSDRLRKYSRHMMENHNDTSANSATAAAATTNDETVKELFPKVQAADMNGIDEVVNEEEPLSNNDELFPRIDGGKSEQTETQQDIPSTEDVPNLVVNSPQDVPPDKGVLANIHAKSPDKKKTIEDNMADQVVVLNPPQYQTPQPVVSNDTTTDPQAVINLDNTVSEISQVNQPEQSLNRRRKLPSLPNLMPSAQSSREAELKQRAQDLIRKASEGDVLLTKNDDSRESELKERAQQLLNAYQSESSPGTNKRIVKTGGGVRVTGNTSQKPNIHVVQKATVVQQQKPAVTPSSSSTCGQDNEVMKQENNNEDLSQESDDNKTAVDDTKNVSDGKESEKEDVKAPAKQAAAVPRQKHRRKKPGMPVAKPVSKIPSSTALRMADNPPADKPVKPVNPLPIRNRSPVQSEDTDDSSDTVKAMKNNVSTTPISRSGTQSPDSTQSPSAWSSHSVDLEESILQSRSDFVVTELRQLQVKLKELDEKASFIELDLRNCMDQGNKEQEERRMKEWFQLLSEKNDIIRRQMELNLIEREEDIERKEYLLRRELRALSAINEDIKTKEQKDQEAKLLQELLRTVEERNNIEQRKMNTQAQKESEAAGFEKAQNRSANLAKNNPASNSNNQNCVIS
ncbi:EH domain-binding protein 1-like [Dysidea avara]|uniref:EH domain-binding protein 1-like n=1 Tax=Dysidea avara TaxID=196820 RepID=UPI0033246DD0